MVWRRVKLTINWGLVVIYFQKENTQRTNTVTHHYSSARKKMRKQTDIQNKLKQKTNGSKKQTNKTVIDEKKIKLGINLLKARLNRKIRPAIDIPFLLFENDHKSHLVCMIMIVILISIYREGTGSLQKRPLYLHGSFSFSQHIN